MKFQNSNPTQVSLNGLENVDDLLRASIEEYKKLGEPLPLGSKSIYLNEQKGFEEFLDPGIELNSIYNQEESKNNSKNPLIIRIIDLEKLELELKGKGILMKN